MHLHLLRSLGRTALLVLAVLASASPSLADVTAVAWYRLGDQDPGAAAGQVASPTTADVLRSRPLGQVGAPQYSTEVSGGGLQIGSALSLRFNGAGQCYSNAPLSTPASRFGIEAWVKPSPFGFDRSVIAYNGRPGLNGWGLVWEFGQLGVQLGGLTFTAGVGSVNQWTHIALVQDSFSATIYVNGVAAQTLALTPSAPTDAFSIGGDPSSPGAASFNGLIDEVRVFTFEVGQFDPGTLLVNQSRVTTRPASIASSVLLYGDAGRCGLPTSAWFEWGESANFGQRTAATAIDFGPVQSFSASVPGLAVGSTYFYRAVASNALGVATGQTESLVNLPTSGDLTLYGGVTVRIEPAAAAADGATWKLETGPTLFSGATRSPVLPGVQTIRFGDLAGRREPTSIETRVVGGKTSEVSVVFTPLVAYDFQSLPEQHVRIGDRLELFVRAGTAVAPFQVTAAPPPLGPITFDAANGRFTYTPAPADRLPFSVVFTFGGQTGTMLVTPLPDLPTEDITLQYGRPLPDEESRDFITISETANAAEPFNDVTVPTLSVDVSGKTLVFDTAHPALLHPQYNGRHNLRDLRLFADRVIIRSPLFLPQTHVSIHARELRFEGGGLIDTTPRPRVLKPEEVRPDDGRTMGRDGDEGHAAGDVDVWVERFHADPSPAIRFVLVGGGGGPAGDGRPGRYEGQMNEDGTQFLYLLGSASWTNLTERTGNVICDFVSNAAVLFKEERAPNGSVTYTCGSQVEARGEPGVPSGHPGRGGRGGILRSTLNLAPHAQLEGGAAGAPGIDCPGGSLFFRYVYLLTTIKIVKGQFVITTSETLAPRVPGATAIAPTGSAGVPGSVVVTNTGWLHPFGVRSVVQYANEAYLNGRTEDARNLLEAYRLVVRTLQPAVSTVTNLNEAELNETTGLDQLALEIDTLLHRLDSHLDYFGNPAGWAPMLSFEANLATFEKEVDLAIRVLYLSAYLTQAATNAQDALVPSTLAVTKLKEEFNGIVSAYNEARTSLPRLRSEADSVITRISGLRQRLTLLEQELANRAAQNVEDRHKAPFWKKALGVVAVAADLIPVGQPTVGKIGSKLGLLANFDPEHPVASAKTNAPKLFEKFTEKNIDVCFTPPGTNATNASQIRQERLKTLTECGKFLGGEVKEIVSIFKEAQIDDKEIAAELEKIKAADPVFQEVVATLTELNLDKERFARELAAALQAIATLTGAITENALATDNLEDRIARGLTRLDHNALVHVREMERRAKQRLLQYQYFTAQAFQYRLLQPYGGVLQLNRLFERFQALIRTNDSHVLSQADFEMLKTVYLAELREIVNQSLVPLNANAPERSQPARFSLGTEELEELNRTGRLTINLRDKGFFASGHENIRIADLRTSQMAVHPAGGAVGNFALCFVDFQHQGVSRLTSRGQSFVFRHYQNGEVNPIVWNTLFDATTGQFSNSEISPAAESLATFLIDQPNNEKLLLFSRPAADAEILITKVASTDNGIDLVIDSMQIQVEYEFFNTSANRPELMVRVNDGLEPVINVSEVDLNGRRDGQGNFQRVYAAGTVVSLQAPSSYGGRPFERWLVNRQPRAAGVTTVTLAMTAPMTVEASYGTEGPALVPLLNVPGQVGFQFSTKAGTRYVVERKGSLNEPAWTPMETILGTGSPVQFSRPIGPGSAFFRLVVE